MSEVKNIPAGEFVGYDLVERVSRPTKIAVLPVGYWHGLPRSLSSVGEVLVNGRRSLPSRSLKNPARATTKSSLA
ncbi:MAG: hypothetical protein HY093_00050 [Candidatus Liptonbacteria bacterium]|nr:hypothetical protein [Candidatus Liptonbacteria bacterium]